MLPTLLVTWNQVKLAYSSLPLPGTQRNTAHNFLFTGDGRAVTIQVQSHPLKPVIQDGRAFAIQVQSHPDPVIQEPHQAHMTSHAHSAVISAV